MFCLLCRMLIVIKRFSNLFPYLPDKGLNVLYSKYVYALFILILNFIYCSAYGSLTVRTLLDTSSHCLLDYQFTDPYSQVRFI